MAPSSVFTIGRSNEADIHLSDSTVSRRHAELVVTSTGEHYVTDCNGSAGTFVFRDGRWERLTQGFVAADEPLRLGDYETCAQALRAAARRSAPANAGPEFAYVEPAAHAAPASESALPRGPVRRNPETGEIMGRND